MPQAIQQRPPHVIALTLALALLMMWPTWIAVRNGLSDLYARPAIDYLKGKRFYAYSVSEAEWQAIENNLTQADKLMPSNPRYLETLGLLQQIKLNVLNAELSIEDIGAHTRAANQYYQQATVARPTWPYYWGSLALEHHRLMHYRLNDYAADEYSLALANASRFGPWINGTQRLVIELGSEGWKFLSPQAKHEFILSVERGLHRQPQNTVRIMSGFDIWPKLCEASSGLLDITSPHLQALCANEQFARQN